MYSQTLHSNQGDYRLAIYDGMDDHPPAHVHVYQLGKGGVVLGEAKFRLAIAMPRNINVVDRSQIEFAVREKKPGRAVLDREDRLRHDMLTGDALKEAERLVNAHFAELVNAWMDEHQGLGTMFDFQRIK